ncbi:MAG: acyl-CoA/acyl-ACP dehydrogenase [Gammaproteobacteria bacterium]
MKTLTAEERTALRDAVHRLLTDGSYEAAVRTAMETESGYDPGLWQQLAEMGVVGLLVDEAMGGSGAGPMELEVVMEEVGAALLCSPLLASGVLAVRLLQALGDDALNARVLPEIATGRCIATAVLTGESGCWTESGVAVSASDRDGQWRLDGTASYVLHGQNANRLIVIARTGDELSAFLVDAAGDGVGIEGLPTFDHTLRLAQVSFEGAAAERIYAAVPVWEAVSQALDLTLVALAGEQAGAAERCLAFTVEYAKTRIQFGRQIGSFQAIKHMAADLLLETESAISAARHAAARLAEGAADVKEAVSLAAFACADAFVKTAADSIQMHGGIAFTWEHPSHLYLRRARADAQLFGTPAYHRERYLEALGA